MIVEYGNLKYGYSPAGWDEVYKNEYGDLNLLRLKLLIEDEAVQQATNLVCRLILRLRLEGKPVRVLDIGAGVGHQLMSIAHLCDRAVGFDISHEVVEHNNSLNNAARFVQGDALKHPPFEEKFDIAMMCGVLYAIDERRETHLQILREAINSIADDGYFLFYHRAYLNLLVGIDKRARRMIQRMKGIDLPDYYMCWFDDAYIIELCREVGFEVVTVSKDDFAYAMTSTFFRYVFAWPRYWDYRSYKEYLSYEREYSSYRRLNPLGRIVCVLSKYVMPFLTARTSLFLLRKKNRG